MAEVSNFKPLVDFADGFESSFEFDNDWAEFLSAFRVNSSPPHANLQSPPAAEIHSNFLSYFAPPGLTSADFPQPGQTSLLPTEDYQRSGSASQIEGNHSTPAPQGYQVDELRSRVHLLPAAGSFKPIAKAKFDSTNEAHKPRWKRNNRGKPVLGNNATGRRGKLKCDPCRKGKGKARNTPDECIKRWGPVTEARRGPSTPSRPLTVYDESILDEEKYLLQGLYSDSISAVCGRSNFTSLSRIFASIYGPSLGHRGGLRHAVMAIITAYPSKSRSRASVSTMEQLHHTYGAHIQRLNDLNTLDEGDLFVAYLLAMGAVGRFGAFESHATGVISIMQHLSKNGQSHMLFSSPLRPFWSLIRDDILWIADYFPEKSLVDTLADRFRQCLGPKNIDQRQRYVNELQRTIRPGDLPNNISGSSPDILLTRCLRLIQKRQLDKSFEQNAYAESILVDCRAETGPTDHERRESWLKINLQAQPGLLEPAESRTLAYYFELISHHLIRLCVAIVEAPSTDLGLCSADGMSAAKSLVSLFNRIHDHVLSKKQAIRGQFWCKPQILYLLTNLG